MKKSFYYIIVLAVLTSCKQEPAKIAAEYNISIDSISKEAPLPAGLTYIPLETTDASLISGIDKILYRDHTFYIFDKIGMRVLLFGEDGKFLNAIHQVGQGPGQYTYPADMDIDEQGNIYLSDFSTRRIIKYGFNEEKYKTSFDISEHFLDFSVTEKNIYLGRIAQKGVFNINLASWDTLKKKMHILKVNKLTEGNDIPYSSSHYFFRSGNKVTYYERFSSDIYLLGADTVKKYIHFESKAVPTADEVREWSRQPMPQRLMENHYLRDVSACYESDNHIFITFQTLPLRYCLINKSTKEACVFQSIGKTGVLGMDVYATIGKDFVSYCPPTKENIEKLVSVSPILNAQDRARFENLKEDNNPILILFHYKIK